MPRFDLDYLARMTLGLRGIHTNTVLNLISKKIKPKLKRNPRETFHSITRQCSKVHINCFLTVTFGFINKNLF